MQQYEFSGGAVRSDSLYVKRSIDEEFFKKLLKIRTIYTIHAPRQSGKTSLWKQTETALREQGFNLCDDPIDLGVYRDGEITKSASAWSDALLRGVVREFSMAMIGDYEDWKSKLGTISNTNLIKMFFSEFLREKLDGPIVICFDEIDTISDVTGFTDMFFNAIRMIGNDCDRLDLSFVLIGINHPRELLKISDPSSFNIYFDVTIEPFQSDKATINSWMEGYPIEDKDVSYNFGKTILEFCGGQPYIISNILHIAQEEDIKTVEKLVILLKRLTKEARNKKFVPSIFNSATVVLTKRDRPTYRLLQLLKKVKIGPTSVPQNQLEYSAILKRSGLVIEESGKLVISSDFVLSVCDEDWIKSLESKVGLQPYSPPMQNFVDPDKPLPKVCVLSFGGMISMEQKADGQIGEPDNLRVSFFKNFPEISSIADIDVVPIDTKDSSEMNPDDWEMIADAVHGRRAESYDGFVVVMGTDTLPHAASAVAFAFGSHLWFPIVFVGAQTAPHILHGDARINLMRAVTVATQELPEVVAVVGDTIHRAVRVQKKDDYRFDGMHSPTAAPLGIIANKVYLYDQQPDVPRIERLDFCNNFCRDVFKITLYPGLSRKFIMPVLDNPNLKGVVIETLGVGNVPTRDNGSEEGDWSLIPFIERATELNIPVLLASQIPVQIEIAKTYEPAQPPLDAGAFTAANMSPPAAITKFMWVLAQVHEMVANGDIKQSKIRATVKNMMKSNFIQEIDEVKLVKRVG